MGAAERYLKAKYELEKILNGQDQCAKMYNALSEISIIARDHSETYTCPLKQVGLNIINHIEHLKNEKLNEGTLTIDDLTQTFNTLIMFIHLNRDATNIAHLLKELKTKIKTEEYNKFAAKVFIFVGLSIILASISLLVACVMTAGTGLIPLAISGLCFIGPIVACGSYPIDGANLNKAIERKQLKNYFFKNRTPDSETACKTLFILESAPHGNY